MKLIRMILLLSFIFWPISAFIYEIKVLRQWDGNTNQYSYFIGCSDFHDKKIKSNVSQRKEIEKLLYKCKNKQNVKVVVEDLSSPNSCGCYGCSHYRFNSRRGILASLAKDCSAMGFDVENIEYRYCRVIATTGMLNKLKTSPLKFEPARMIGVSCVLREFESAKHEILGYNDCHILQKLYHKGLDQIGHTLDKLKLTNYQNESVAYFLDKNTKISTRLSVLKRFLTFDSRLLDFKLAHAVLNKNDLQQTVIAFAGGTHVDRACDLLKTVGYEKVRGSKLTYYKECDLSKCLGSQIVDGKFCVRPQPVSLKVLRNYLK